MKRKKEGKKLAEKKIGQHCWSNAVLAVVQYGCWDEIADMTGTYRLDYLPVRSNAAQLVVYLEQKSIKQPVWINSLLSFFNSNVRCSCIFFACLTLNLLRTFLSNNFSIFYHGLRHSHGLHYYSHYPLTYSSCCALLQTLGLQDSDTGNYGNALIQSVVRVAARTRRKS